MSRPDDSMPVEEKQGVARPHAVARIPVGEATFNLLQRQVPTEWVSGKERPVVQAIAEPLMLSLQCPDPKTSSRAIGKAARFLTHPAGMTPDFMRYNADVMAGINAAMGDLVAAVRDGTAHLSPAALALATSWSGMCMRGHVPAMQSFVTYFQACGFRLEADNRNAMREFFVVNKLDGWATISPLAESSATAGASETSPSGEERKPVNASRKQKAGASRAVIHSGGITGAAASSAAGTLCGAAAADAILAGAGGGAPPAVLASAAELGSNEAKLYIDGMGVRTVTTINRFHDPKSALGTSSDEVKHAAATVFVRRVANSARFLAFASSMSE